MRGFLLRGCDMKDPMAFRIYLRSLVFWTWHIEVGFSLLLIFGWFVWRPGNFCQEGPQWRSSRSYSQCNVRALNISRARDLRRTLVLIKIERFLVFRSDFCRNRVFTIRSGGQAEIATVEPFPCWLVDTGTIRNLWVCSTDHQEVPAATSLPHDVRVFPHVIQAVTQDSNGSIWSKLPLDEKSVNLLHPLSAMDHERSG